MEWLPVVKELLQKDDWLCTVDLKNAYLSVAVAQDPQIHLRRQDLSVRVPPVWPLQCPKSIHEAAMASNGLSTEVGPSISDIPGWPTADGLPEGIPAGQGGGGNIPVEELGVPDQPDKSLLSPPKEDRLTHVVQLCRNMLQQDFYTLRDKWPKRWECCLLLGLVLLSIIAICNTSWFNHSDSRLYLTSWWPWMPVQNRTWSGGPNICPGMVKVSSLLFQTSSWRWTPPKLAGELPVVGSGQKDSGHSQRKTSMSIAWNYKQRSSVRMVERHDPEDPSSWDWRHRLP